LSGIYSGIAVNI